MLRTHLNCMEWSEKWCAQCASVTRQRLRRANDLNANASTKCANCSPKWRPLYDALVWMCEWVRVSVCTRQRAGHWAKGPSAEYTWSIGVGCLLRYTCCCYCCSSRTEVVQLPLYTHLTQRKHGQSYYACCMASMCSANIVIPYTRRMPEQSAWTMDMCCTISMCECMGKRVRLRQRFCSRRCVRTEKHRSVHKYGSCCWL